MNCNCAKYQPIELKRKSVNKRIRETKAITTELNLLAENTEKYLKLFQCPVCHQYWQSGHDWQSGHEWNFGDKEYVFQVPAIEIGEWLMEPFA